MLAALCALKTRVHSLLSLSLSLSLSPLFLSFVALDALQRLLAKLPQLAEELVREARAVLERVEVRAAEA